MGDRIQISRFGERFSSHTQAQSRTRHSSTLRDTGALRDRLITATVEALAEGSDPRLQ